MGRPKKNQEAPKMDKPASTEVIKKVENTVKEKLYYELMENGMPKKFANMNNPLVCRRKGVIKIESTRRKPNVDANVSFSRTYDPVTRTTYGIPLGVDEKGKIILKRFYLKEFKEFNLINQDEAEEWAILRHHEMIKNGFYKIYDEEEVAQKEINKISLITKAVAIAQDMKLKDWIPAARFFGHVPEGMSAIILQSTILNIAKDTPGELIDYWEQDNREVIDVFNSAKAVGIIAHHNAKGWLYEKGYPLGSTEEAAIRSLSKDPALCRSIAEKSKGLDIALKSIVEGKSKKKTSFDLLNEEDEEGKEINDLQMKAQLLNIAGYDLMDIDQLRTRVADAEALVMRDEE